MYYSPNATREEQKINQQNMARCLHTPYTVNIYSKKNDQAVGSFLHHLNSLYQTQPHQDNLELNNLLYYLA